MLTITSNMYLQFKGFTILQKVSYLWFCIDLAHFQLILTSFILECEKGAIRKSDSIEDTL